MATGGSGKKGKESQGAGTSSKIDGLGATLVFTGGALAGAALLYGAKKLYDYLSAEKVTAASKEVDEDPDPRPERARRADLSQSPFEDPAAEEPSLMLLSGYSHPQVVVTETLVSPLSDGTSSFVSATSLHDGLLDYYTSYVDVPKDDQALALSVVQDVGQSFHCVLDELLRGTPLTGLISSGPSAEGLNVVRPDFFQLTVQLALDPNLWELVDAGQTLLGAHGYQMVKRMNLEFFSRGTTMYDKYLIGEYLSPLKVKSAFLDLTNRVNNWGSPYQIKSAVIGPSVKLHVVYGEETGQQRKLTVELIPGVKLGGVQLLATTHTTSILEKPGYANLWMQSFEEQEWSQLTSWRPTSPQSSSSPEDEVSTSNTDTAATEVTEVKAVLVDTSTEDQIASSDSTVSDSGCQLMCLQLLEAVRLNHPAQLGMLTPYCVRTIVLHLMTFEDGWLQEELSERFLDSLKLLEEYLRAHNLPHFFCPKLNLFENIDPETLDMARDFLAAVVGNNQFPALLKTNY